MRWRGLLSLGFAAAALAAGCQKGEPPLAARKAPEVIVRRAAAREVTDFEEFTGSTAAVKTVEVKAQVSGYLNAVHFKEGGEVKEGDLLFEIDPRPFQAEVERTEGNLIQAEAHLKRLEADLRRAQEMLPLGSIGREEFDRISGDRAESRGMVASARGARDTARLNLEYSRVKAPITGRISRRWVDPGNMIKSGDTTLTLIVTVDPMYALFDVDERTFRRTQSYLENRGTSESARKEVPVFMGLVDEEGFPHKGSINFVDNRVDPNSVSVWVRGTFPNKDRKLTPGLFVRVHLPIGDPYKAVVIPERALGTDQGQKFVYVLNDKNEAIYTRVQPGEQHGPDRVVNKYAFDKKGVEHLANENGIKEGDRVIVSGLQRVRPGKEVAPQEEKSDDKAPPSGEGKVAGR
jgi:RND family efflux transporter MFP subunit